MRNFSLLLVLALGALGTSPARAQDFDAAGKHFTSAQEAFAKKLYRVSATEFQAAYDLTKDPLLLYNIAESWQKSGDGKKAVASYKAYLKAQPTAQDKGEVQKRIKAIEAQKYKLTSQSAEGDDPEKYLAQKAAEKPVTPPPATPPPPEKPPEKPPEDQPMAPKLDDKPMAPAEATPPPKPPAPAVVDKEAPRKDDKKDDKKDAAGLLDDAPASKMRIAAWIGVAATVAVLTTGAILGLAAQARSDDIQRRLNFVDATGQPHQFDATQATELKNLRDEGNLYNGLAIGFFAGAGALAVTTVVLFAVDHINGKRAEQKKAAAFLPRVNGDVSPGRAHVSLGWSF